MKLKVLLEAEDFEDDFEDEVIDDDGEMSDIVDDTVDQELDDTDTNEVIKKKISFPVIIEGLDENSEPMEVSQEDKEEIAGQYADAVNDIMNENKKFIMSALDIYDFECFFDSIDVNSFVHFTVTLKKDLNNDSLMNVLKRYFNLEVPPANVEGGEVTISPVVDNKYITII